MINPLQDSQDPRSPQPYQPQGRRSLPEQRWSIWPALVEEAQHLAQATGLSPLLTQVLLNRGIRTPEEALVFLDPEVLTLPSPLDEFPDLARSVELLMQAIARREKIAICGDYDADGMTSTALLLRALRTLGATVDYAIPSRMQEGYGINTRIVEEFYREGVSVILTVDNGIAAVEPIAYARDLGLVVIVTDHHDVPPQIPPAHAILNPKLIADTSPYRGVAGVGIAYILAVCLAQALGQTQDLTAPLLELFTLGTIADLAPLTGVNRRWVRRGLKLLPKSRLVGVQSLIQVAGLGAEAESLKPEDIGFRLGPRINAVGRIGDPQVVIELLTTEDVAIAQERAMQCEQANQTRRELCDRIEAEAIAWIEAQQPQGAVDLLRDRVLLIVQPHWHHGVIGIVASRLVERYGVPVFIGTYEDADQRQIRGSARGIPEFHVFAALQSCHDLLTKFGGHQAAGGFSFPTKHLRQIKSRLVRFAHRSLQPEHLKPLVRVDVQATLADLSRDLYDQIDFLHPCGIENPDPVFWTPNVRVVEQRAIGKAKTHLQLQLADVEGTSLAAIAWRWGDYCPLPSRLDIAYKLKLHAWQGVVSVQLEIVGVRLPTSSFPPQSPAARPLPTQAATAATLTLPLTPAQVPGSPDRSAATSPPQTATVDSLPVEGAAVLLTEADFFYSHRRYRACIVIRGEQRELQIHHPEGQVLGVLLPQRQGYLSIPGELARAVDVNQADTFNLVRAGLNALELRQKDHLLRAKEALLAEKDQHIAMLTQQVQWLQQQVGQISSPQQAQWQALQAAAEAQETAVQTQEAELAVLQAHLHRASPEVETVALQQTVQAALGDTVWFCLQADSQRDVCAAYQMLVEAGSNDQQVHPVDYSEAGVRLGAAVEREVIRPWFQDLQTFLQAQGVSALGDLSLATCAQAPLRTAAALLADQWRSLRSQALQLATHPGDAALTQVQQSPWPLSQGDRSLIVRFLDQWDHPMSRWFKSEPEAGAAYLAQIGQLYELATQAATPLPPWAFERMRHLVVGDGQRPGLFQRIYGKVS